MNEEEVDWEGIVEHLASLPDDTEVPEIDNQRVWVTLVAVCKVVHKLQAQIDLATELLMEVGFEGE